MQSPQRVTIVGVGLIGASLGLALKRQNPPPEVVGIGRRASSLRRARKCGAIDRATTDMARGVAGADLVVVCTPPEAIVPAVEAVVAAHPAALVTDAGSTKAEIVEALEKSLPAAARFVGSHPLAGNEKSGPEHGRANLFAGRVVVVTPTRKTRRADTRAVGQFWRRLGAQVVELAPREHDRRLAATSHLPHLVAAAIAAATPSRYASLVATGWLDTTRIAGGDPQLWRQILLANRGNVLDALERVEGTLAALRSALERGDAARLEALLKKGKHRRDALGS